MYLCIYVFMYLCVDSCVHCFRVRGISTKISIKQSTESYVMTHTHTYSVIQDNEPKNYHLLLSVQLYRSCRPTEHPKPFFHQALSELRVSHAPLPFSFLLSNSLDHVAQQNTQNPFFTRL